MVAEWFTLVVVGLMAVAEMMHHRRSRRVARLAFGPGERAAGWTRPAPLLRVAGTGVVCWGLMTLLMMDPKVHSREEIDPTKLKNLVIVLDVSPSMFLKDAGPEKDKARRKRASDVLVNMFNRMPIRQYRISLIAFYNGAKPLLEQSTDVEIISHIIEEMPTYIGFKPGKTDLFAGLQMASEVARSWNPQSTTVLVVTDGVTVPTSGMPRMPASVANVLIVGVGDSISGKFIDGHQSRQDVSNLRQIANRLGGIYLDANSKHIPSVTIESLVSMGREANWLKFSKRELALAMVFLGSLVLSLLPPALHYFGSHWRPGVKIENRAPEMPTNRLKPGVRSTPKSPRHLVPQSAGED
jgi:Ca-activated chloride channel homolog